MSLAVGGVQSTRNYWWWTLIRSLVFILFGIAALLWPGPTLAFFIYLFGVFAIVEGIIAVATAIQERQVYKNWWVLMLAGIAGIIVGILVFSWPGITSLILFYMVAAWAFVVGIMAIVSAFSRFTLPGVDWPLILGGVVLIVLGLVMAAHPVVSILSLLWVLGLAAVIYGVLLFVRSFQFKSLQDRGAPEYAARGGSGEYGYADQSARGGTFGEYNRPDQGARSSFQTYDDYPAQSTRSNVPGTDNTPQGRTPGTPGTTPTSMPPGRNPSTPETTPTSMPPGRTPGTPGTTPTSMPPGRNPTTQGTPPTTMPPGRNPTVQGDLSTGETAPRRDATPPGGTTSQRGTMPTQDNVPTRGNVPPRDGTLPGNRPPAKGNVPPRDNIPPENSRPSDTFEKDKPSWLEDEENS